MDFIDFFMHLDDHLNTLVQNYGSWTYLILFLIIFCETGLVVTPFLPGDSLLFAVGALAGAEILNIQWILLILSVAAILGNTANYTIGRILAPKVFRQEKIPFLKQKYLEQTQKFFEKYGGKTIIITRFVPIIRTFAPFLAGVGAMSYRRFLLYNIAGGLLWVFSLTLAGYYFGGLEFVPTCIEPAAVALEAAHLRIETALTGIVCGQVPRADQPELAGNGNRLVGIRREPLALEARGARFLRQQKCQSKAG